MIILNILTFLLLCYVAYLLYRFAGIDTGITPNKTSKFIIDTSALVDGRVYELTSVIPEDAWVVTDGVIAELKQLADNKSEKFSSQRVRAKHALGVLADLRPFIAEEQTDHRVEDVDQELLRLAQRSRFTLITLDKNLINQARAVGITVINPDSLRTALMPVMYVGDMIEVKVIAKSEKKQAALAVTQWGEVVTLEGGAKYMSKTLKVEVQKISVNSQQRNVLTKLI